MLRQTLQLFVVVAGVAFASGAHAQTSDWSVQSDAAREAKVVRRYRQLLLHNPDQTLVYRSLIAKLGRGPALDPFIADIRQRAQDGPGAAAWILLGHLERDRGHANASLDAYRQAVAAEPDSATAHAALGAALDRAGLGPAADTEFERALGLSDGAKAQRRLLRRLADSAASRGDHQRAIQWMERLVGAQPRDYALRVELAETQLRAHRFDAALHTYQEAEKLAGRSGKRRAQTLVDIGNLHRRMHDPVAAERAYRHALGLIGGSSWMRREVLMRLVDVARDMGTLSEMVAELVREWPAPGYHDAMILAGLSEELGRDADAIHWLERAARLDRHAIEPRTRLIARLEHTDPARVRKLYDEIVALRPEDLAQRLERIEWLFFRGSQVEAAIAQLRRVEKDVRGDAGSLVEVAATFQRFGMVEQALRIHEALQKTHPDDVVHLEAYGELLTRLGRKARAEEVWGHLFDLDPQDPGTRLRVAEIAAKLHDYGRATELLEWVVERFPRLVDARQRLAGLYETREMWPQALAHWETLFFDDGVTHAGRRIVAIAERTAFVGSEMVTPDDHLLQRWEKRYADHPTPRTGVVLARLRTALGDGFGGIELAKRIAGLDPRMLPTSQHGAWLDAADLVIRDAEDRDPLAAIALLERVAAAFGDRRSTSWRRAIDLALRLDDAAAVRPIVERALAAVPNDPYVHSQAGVFYGSVQETETAIEHYRRAVALGTSNYEVYFDLAFHLTQARDFAGARDVFVDVMRSDASGNWATSAAFSAIDLCRSDEELLRLEAEVARLRGRLPEQAFYDIVVATYLELFAYSDDPARAFATVGTRALPLLAAAMQSDSDEDRAHAAELLRLYPPDSVATAALATWSPDSRTWTADMVWALARTRASAAASPLIHAVESDDEDTRRAAVFGLGFARVSSGDRVLARLFERTDATPTERALAAAALGRLGTRVAVDALQAQAATSRPSEVREVATWALGQSDGALAANALAGRLGDPVSSVGKLAGVMLGRLEGDNGLRALLHAAWDADPGQRAMAEHGLRAAPLIDPIWSLDDVTLPRPDRLVASAVREALAAHADEPVARRYVGHERVVVSVATQRLRDGHAPLVLQHLVAAADEAGDELAPSIRRIVRGLRPRLREITRSGPAPDRLSAALLLPIAQNPKDAPLVAEVAGELDEKDASRVVERLSVYPWKTVRPTLVKGLGSPRALRRAASVRALSSSRAAAQDSEAVDLVAGLAHDPDPDVQVAAIEALGALRHSDSVEMLAALYDDASPRAQRAIRASLSRMSGEVAAREALRLSIRPTQRVCEGDPGDLSDLLQDDCAGAVEVPDF